MSRFSNAIFDLSPYDACCWGISRHFLYLGCRSCPNTSWCDIYAAMKDVYDDFVYAGIDSRLYDPLPFCREGKEDYALYWNCENCFRYGECNIRFQNLCMQFVHPSTESERMLTAARDKTKICSAEQDLFLKFVLMCSLGEIKVDTGDELIPVPFATPEQIKFFKNLPQVFSGDNVPTLTPRQLDFFNEKLVEKWNNFIETDKYHSRAEDRRLINLHALQLKSIRESVFRHKLKKTKSLPKKILLRILRRFFEP